MNRKALAGVAAIGVLAACDGFREAMTAHVDVVARAGSQELSVNRLSELLGNSKAPLRNQAGAPNREVAKAVAELWVNYQLLGQAAADGDSLTSPKVVDEAMWAAIAGARANKWFDVVSKTWNVGGDTAAAAASAEARYNQGEILAARHILLSVPQGGAGADTVRRRADALRAQATPANFAELATKNSQDPGSARQGGLYAGFPRGQMVPEFEKALLALKPGEISPVVQTQFGYHIIYRPPFGEVKSQLTRASDQRGLQVAESTYFANLEKSANVQVKPDAPRTVKAVAKDIEGNLDNRTVVATSTMGDFTAGRLARWFSAAPAQARLSQQIETAPDTLIPTLVRNFVRNELFLRQADSAKITLDSTEMQQIRRDFGLAVSQAWSGLGVEPKALADSAKTEDARERLAAARVEAFMDNLLTREGRFVEVPKPLETALHDKYDSKLNDAGLDRALERAIRVRATADSTRAAQQPQSAVPMPGQQPSGEQAQPGQAQPDQPAAKAPAQPPAKNPPQPKNP